MNIIQSRQGQTAIFVFLLLIVGLTIGVSLAGRTILNLQSSSGSDFSSRAFSAAEAGAEDALRQDLSSISGGAPVNGSFSANSKATYSYQVTSQAVTSQVVDRDYTSQVILQDPVTSVYFSGRLNIYWARTANVGTGGENNSTPPISAPSLEITLIKCLDTCVNSSSNLGGNHAVFKTVVNAVNRSTFLNPSSTQIIPGTNTNVKNDVGSTSGQSTNTTYTNLVEITIPAGENYEFARIKPIYNHSGILVNDAQGKLPKQSYVVVSQGKSATSTRKVQVSKSPPSMPSIFDFVLFNGSNVAISK